MVEEITLSFNIEGKLYLSVPRKWELVRKRDKRYQAEALFVKQNPRGIAMSETERLRGKVDCS